MVMNQTSWGNKPEVRKGEIGEKIVREYLEEKGYIVYKPMTDGPHGFDILAVKNKEKLAVVEVKTKASLNKYPATGFDVKHYKEYKNISEKYGLDLFVFFVDEMLGKVYFNRLRRMEEKITIDGVDYPNMSIVKGIIIFPLKNMILIKKLSEKEIEKLKALSNRNYGYKLVGVAEKELV